MNNVYYRGNTYPELQSTGFASRFAFEFAKEFCKGKGFDVGFNRNEWKFDGAIGIDYDVNGFHAMNLPDIEINYIFSSHFLEHYVGRFQDVIEYWLSRLKKGGIIFLYLPNCDYQKYWAWGNKKHIHYLSPSILDDYCKHIDISTYLITEGYDLNGSFYCIIEK